ncbi:MAG: lasso peptide biosynthesis B2 protein [Sphingomonas sp.]|uniref:lasso peptide biosynthesis B2 protein n=1 Tax=Sphingomonas sp. TaxID=28214 RepID=UPI001B0ABFDB|nr:lasso peptide biosynthesis B2 protein [Sphingomonas sp.]MBO9623961.1 lasso peptide biosynthesis B2 protein [Sphingomonas sp.]
MPPPLARLLHHLPDPGTPLPCPGPERARISLAAEGGSASPATVVQMVARRLTSRAALRLWSLERVIARWRARKTCSTRGGDADAMAKRVASAYRASTLILGSHDHCLPDSLAVASQLLRYGVRAELVLGVKLDPFQAHCWVQMGDAVVNDSLDATRLFTPVLVV